MKDCVEDYESKFGPFCKRPEMVTFLPGIKPLFDNFVQAVIKYKASFESPTDKTPLTSTPKPSKKQKKENQQYSFSSESRGA